MLNFNGDLVASNSDFLNHENRAFKYGDALEERLRLISGKIPFWEDHYFRLVAGMRILRMKIPMHFTMEFLKEQILNAIPDDNPEGQFAINLFIFRNDTTNLSHNGIKVSFLIEAKPIASPFYEFEERDFEIELFKDHFIASGLLSSVGTSNKVIETLAGVFAAENDYQGCFLLNTDKQIIDSTHGTIFLVKDEAVKTSPIDSGTKNRVLRKKVIEIFQKWEGFSVQEQAISPFELQKADEIFVCDDIDGIISIKKYRKKTFDNKIAKQVLGRLNALARFT